MDIQKFSAGEEILLAKQLWESEQIEANKIELTDAQHQNPANW